MINKTIFLLLFYNSIVPWEGDSNHDSLNKEDETMLLTYKTFDKKYLYYIRSLKALFSIFDIVYC